jgi:CheY-like chemotaxis protein
MSRTDHIFLIEDDPEDVFLFRRALKKVTINQRSLELHTFSNGQQAIDKMAELYKTRLFSELPSLIFCDINMPIMNGFEFLETIKKNANFMTIPVVVMSTTDDILNIKQCYKSGANAVLTKAATEFGINEMLQTCMDFWLNHNQNVDLESLNV